MYDIIYMSTEEGHYYLIPIQNGKTVLLR